MRILILEDNELIAKFLWHLLNNEGIYSDIVLTYDEALAKINTKYDWIITDYFLQRGETGLDFIELYKQKNPQHRVKVLVYSANMEKIESDVVDKIIYKTVNADELMEFVKNELKNGDSDSKGPIDYELIEIKKTLEDLIQKYDSNNTLLNAHDKKIAIFESNLENFKGSFQKLEAKVDGVSKNIGEIDKSVGELSKKQASSSVTIILWVAGIVISSYAGVTAIIYEMIKNMIKK